MTVRVIRSHCADTGRAANVTLASVRDRRPYACTVTCHACGEAWESIWSAWADCDTVPDGQHYTVREVSLAVWQLVATMRERQAETERSIGATAIALLTSPTLRPSQDLPLDFAVTRQRALRLKADELESLMLAREGNGLTSAI